MYLSAERIAVANKAVRDTFEQTSIAWQAIPHWDTGDPAQTKVRCDSAYAPLDDMGPLGESPVAIVPFTRYFYLTVAQATSPTPDALLDAVIARTVQLAGDVDAEVIDELVKKSQPAPGNVATNEDPAKLLNALIDARAAVENAGYRAPSCLLTNTGGLKAISQLDLGFPVLEPLLDAANVNSRYRVDTLGKPDGGKGAGGPDKPEGDKGADGPDKPDGDKNADKLGKPDEDDGVSFATGVSGKANPDDNGRLLLLGRRRRIAHGGAAETSPGEEPVDLAISVPPSLEVIGETKTGYIELAVRVRFAPRVTDKNGVVGVVIS
jgi:hypothetical protein